MEVLLLSRMNGGAAGPCIENICDGLELQSLTITSDDRGIYCCRRADVGIVLGSTKEGERMEMPGRLKISAPC